MSPEASWALSSADPGVALGDAALELRLGVRLGELGRGLLLREPGAQLVGLLADAVRLRLELVPQLGLGCALALAGLGVGLLQGHLLRARRGLELRPERGDLRIALGQVALGLLAGLGGRLLDHEGALLVGGVEPGGELGDALLPLGDAVLEFAGGRGLELGDPGVALGQGLLQLPVRLGAGEGEGVLALARVHLLALVQVVRELLVAHLPHDVGVAVLVDGEHSSALGAFDLAHVCSPRLRRLRRASSANTIPRRADIRGPRGARDPAAREPAPLRGPRSP